MAKVNPVPRTGKRGTRAPQPRKITSKKVPHISTNTINLGTHMITNPLNLKDELFTHWLNTPNAKPKKPTTRKK
jgi:hypothetical protein